ncbi:5894_t:CDS:2 [Ambispora gerdemannii]|uniref:5894_t:CDS:1 n=1 Tax=Ambispora gerdemannii TaxID=144530 RepID=A0A9N8Z810_9GLOM|nr:5894_t:CDS:2 [Ambispora gerdemannii]
MLNRRLFSRTTRYFLSPLSNRRRQHYFHSSQVAQTGQELKGTDQNFEKLVEQASEPVIVDFYADWCGPCRVLGPLIKKVVEANKKVTLVKLDIEENKLVAEKFMISSLPTVKAFHKGKEIDTFIGLRDSSFIKDFVEKTGSLATDS